jgi:diguanylate cyclase (GGDEF)-like protein
MIGGNGVAMAQRSIHRRSAGLLAAFAIGPLLLMLGVGVTLSLRETIRHAAVTLRTAQQADDHLLDNFMRVHQHALLTLAASPTLRTTFGAAELAQRLETVRASLPGFVTLFGADPRGQVLMASPALSRNGRADYWQGVSVADRDYFRQTLARRAVYVSGIFTSRAYSNQKLIAIGVPVFAADGTSLRGVLAAGVDPARLGMLLDRIAEPSGAACVILDASGHVVYASPALHIRVDTPAMAQPLLRATLAMPAVQIGDIDPRLLGVRLALHAPAKALPGWQVLLLGRPELISHNLEVSGRLFLLFGGLLLVALCVALPFVARGLQRPVRTLATRLVQFDPDREDAATPGVDPDLPRELRPIEDAFRAMATRLRELYLQRNEIIDEREHEVERRTRELRRAADALRDASLTDGLTGLANYRAYRKQLDALWAAARVGGHEIGALTVDIDHFKGYNDRYGHPAGDVCLRAVADCLRETLGTAPQLLARNGGEEFIALFMPAERRRILELAGQLHQAVRALAIEHAASPTGIVTLSIGVSVLVPAPGLFADALVRAADLALYRAKREGRDRVAELSPAVLQRPLPSPAAD